MERLRCYCYSSAKTRGLRAKGQTSLSILHPYFIKMKRKFEVWLPLLLSGIMVLGMYVGYRFATGQPNKKIFKKDRTTSLQEALDIIRTRYVDSVQLDTLQSNALREMM